ncbi:MAG: purine-nucleoside phosphorylase [Bacteroidota bacterium]
MQKLKETVSYLQSAGMDQAEVGIILGTGLSKLVDKIDVLKKIPYEEIPHFPVSTVSFHKGELIYGMLAGRKVIAMHGRFHYYEGYSLQEIVFPVRVMKLLGIHALLVSNACGTMNMDFPKGSLMMLTDHINLLGDNPLIGPNYDELGPRFPDMSEPYSGALNDQLRQIAVSKGIKLHEGIYVAVPGPMLETRAEYRYLRRIGADVVGMSTVPEAIAARHMSLPCAAVSVITDECDPDNLAVADIVDILKTAARAEKDLIVLFEEMMGRV